MINRDGHATSLWQSIEPYEPTNQLPGENIIYDVIIAGGGITGVSTALLLQKAGKKCLLLEANNLCFGTTGGTTAHLNTLLDTSYDTIAKNFGERASKLVAQSVREAIDLIKRNIEEYQLNCGFEKCPGYLFAQNVEQEEELEELIISAQAVGIDVEYTNEIPVPIAFTKAVRFEDQAKFIPTKYVFGLAKAFEHAGGIIIQNCRVSGANENKTVEVETSLGNFTAQALIYATHIPPTINLLHLRCVPFRSYAMAVTLKDEKYPEGLIYNMYEPYNYYRSQVVDGQPFLIGGGYDHKTAHEDNTDKYFTQLEAHMRGNFKVNEVAFKWSSQYFEPADGLPYIGPLPGHSGNIYAATGFSGNGMVYSSVAAMLLTRILLNQESLYQDIYNPSRVKPVAGFVNFIQHNADVVKQFAGKWFPHEELESLSGLAAGDGAVVKYEDHKLAVYKDKNGVIHAVNPICTHMKCEVKWNAAERSWDCPCHGARFSIDGKVLTGPADFDLEKVEIRSLQEK